MKQSEIQNQRKQSSTRSRAADRQKPILVVLIADIHSLSTPGYTDIPIHTKFLDDYNMYNTNSHLLTVVRTGHYLITFNYIFKLTTGAAYGTSFAVSNEVLVDGSTSYAQAKSYSNPSPGVTTDFYYTENFLFPLKLYTGQKLQFRDKIDSNSPNTLISNMTIQIELLR